LVTHHVRTNEGVGMSTTEGYPK